MLQLWLLPLTGFFSMATKAHGYLELSAMPKWHNFSEKVKTITIGGHYINLYDCYIICVSVK